MICYHSFFLFFFYSSGTHRDLHSFPTRRSSDLADAAFVGGPDEEFTGRCAAILANGKRCPNASLPGSRFCGVPGSDADRKSTRLNSSHQIISYAVFCLKKKKKKNNKRHKSSITI